jgi:hypothetical protein
LTGRPRATRLILLAAVLTTLVSCATGVRYGALPPVATAEQRWQSLQELGAAIETLSAHSRFRLTSAEGARTFSSRMSIDRAGRFELIAFTPAGTAAATLFVDGRNVIFIDQMQRAYWQGSTAELEGLSPFLALFATIEPAQLGRLLFGLPARTGTAPCRYLDGSAAGSCISDGVFDYQVTPEGLVTARGPDFGIAWQPPVVPPDRLTIVVGSQQFEIAHLDVIEERRTLRPPVIGSDLRCCIVPALE